MVYYYLKVDCNKLKMDTISPKQQWNKTTKELLAEWNKTTKELLAQKEQNKKFYSIQIKGKKRGKMEQISSKMVDFKPAISL